MNRFDFEALVVVNGANPNGDPLGGNIPRTDSLGYGEISDVCIKHKIRTALAMAANGEVDDEGNCDTILLSGADYGDKQNNTISELLKDIPTKGRTSSEIAFDLGQKFRDVRLFGFLWAAKGGEGGKGVSVGITGPASIQSAKSVAPVAPVMTQITKSMSMDGGKSSDTMGAKYRVDRSAYVIKGSVSPYLGEKSGLTEADVVALKNALTNMFTYDSSAARPAGTMEVVEIYWFDAGTQNGRLSTAETLRTVDIKPCEDFPFYKTETNFEKLPANVTVEHWQSGEWETLKH